MFFEFQTSGCDLSLAAKSKLLAINESIIYKLNWQPQQDEYVTNVLTISF